jgi:hypothetical protein
MADASIIFAIRAIAVTDSTWTPVITPINCTTWALRPDADVRIRTDSADANTEDIIKAGVQELLLAGTGHRYPAGQTFAFLQAVTGSTIVRAQFSA